MRVGVAVAFASLTKLYPALLLLPFAAKRRVKALVAFALIWAVTLVIIIVMDRNVIAQYLLINRSESARTIKRDDNSAALVSAYRFRATAGAPVLGGERHRVVGAACLLLLLIFLTAILYVNRYAFIRSPTSPRLIDITLYFSVVFLPVAWVYSHLPLLLIAGRLINGRALAPTLVALTHLLLTTVSQPYGPGSALPLSAATVLLGVGMLTGRSRSWVLSLTPGEQPDAAHRLP